MQFPGATLDELLGSIGGLATLLQPCVGWDRVFSNIGFLTGSPEDERPADTIWVYAATTDRRMFMLDTWILALANQGSCALIVVGQTVSDASRLLATRLCLPVLVVEPEHLGDLMGKALRLLVGREAKLMERELGLIDGTLSSWAQNTTMEGFQRDLACHEIRVDSDPVPGAEATHVVGWGRGSGERFFIETPLQSPRLAHLLELALGVFLDRDAAEIESMLRHRSEFLLELLVDPGVPTGSVMRAAARYNLDLGLIHTAFIWDLDDFAQFAATAHSEQRILRTKGAVLDTLESGARRVFGHGMVLPHSDEFVMIVEGRERLLPDQAVKGAQAMADCLTPILERHAVAGVTCGIGFPYDGPDGLRKSFEEAHEALTVGRARYGFGTIAHFKDLGLDRFLYGWLESPRSRKLSDGLLGPVLAEPNSGELIETLRVYLDCMGRRSQASQMLHIHRNTLGYRIQRLQQLLKLDLDDSAAQLVLQLALKAHPKLH